MTSGKKIYFVRMQRDYTHFWHYIAVTPLKAPLVSKVSSDKTIDLKEIGDILDSGWGFFPPKDIAAKYPEISTNQ